MVSEQFDFFYRAKNEKSSSFRCDDVLLQQFFLTSDGLIQQIHQSMSAN